uniref:Uncharacterized protein n=1 Tax=Anguilla anguilla TaxID=7936 RepID=A0A0E9PR64_ANGAN
MLTSVNGVNIKISQHESYCCAISLT